jgi:hypothetical protein
LANFYHVIRNCWFSAHNFTQTIKRTLHAPTTLQIKFAAKGILSFIVIITFSGEHFGDLDPASVEFFSSFRMPGVVGAG